MMPLNKICVYGTLRRHQANYTKIIGRYGLDEFRYKRTLDIPGFLMYDLIYYPAVQRSGNPSDKIIVELFDASDAVYLYIKDMEIGAGYTEDTVCIGDVFYSIYLLNDMDDRIPIDGGDWLKHLNNLEYYNH